MESGIIVAKYPASGNPSNENAKSGRLDKEIRKGGSQEISSSWSPGFLIKMLFPFRAFALSRFRGKKCRPPWPPCYCGSPVRLPVAQLEWRACDDAKHQRREAVVVGGHCSGDGAHGRLVRGLQAAAEGVGEEL